MRTVHIFRCFVLPIFLYDLFGVQIMSTHVHSFDAFIFYSYFFLHIDFTEAYRRECLATAVKLLEKICKGIKPVSYQQSFLNVPVACMNLVASVSNFVNCNKQEVCEMNHVKQSVCF